MYRKRFSDEEYSKTAPAVDAVKVDAQLLARIQQDLAQRFSLKELLDPLGDPLCVLPISCNGQYHHWRDLAPNSLKFEILQHQQPQSDCKTNKIVEPDHRGLCRSLAAAARGHHCNVWLNARVTTTRRALTSSEVQLITPLWRDRRFVLWPKKHDTSFAAPARVPPLACAADIHSRRALRTDQ